MSRIIKNTLLNYIPNNFVIENEINSARIFELNQNYVKDGSLAGTMQEWKRLEALKIKVESSYEGNIEYQSYIEGKGWEKSYKKNKKCKRNKDCRNCSNGYIFK